MTIYIHILFPKIGDSFFGKCLKGNQKPSPTSLENPAIWEIIHQPEICGDLGMVYLGVQWSGNKRKPFVLLVDFKGKPPRKKGETGSH